MNRLYIKSDVIMQVKLKKIEEEKKSLRRQREFIFEQQRQAFQKQQKVTMEQIMINEAEQEEDYGMSM